MHQMEEREARIRPLEVAVNELQRRFNALNDKLGQVSEDSARQYPDDSAGRIFIRGQSVGVIPGSTSNVLATGTFRFIQVISGARYLMQPFALGDVTATCVNDTGAATVNNEYLILVVADGLFTALVGDCATMTPTRAPDPP